MVAVKSIILLLSFVGVGMAYTGYTGSLSEPVYTLENDINVSPNNDADRTSINNGIVFNANETHYEWENYDGWFNNPAHPDWGGAGECTSYFNMLAIYRSLIQSSCYKTVEFILPNY